MPIPIPESTAALIGKVDCSKRHPGLQLDRYMVDLANQERQKLQLADVVVASAALAEDFPSRFVRHRSFLTAAGATTFEGQTSSPLTLHLSRASAFENAGLCLHPIGGFAYLPGSGLKGLARAYAETVWLPSLPEPSRRQGFEQIEQVFGYVPGSNDKRPWVNGLVDLDRKTAHVGEVVFHDAWPTTVPALTVDVVNSHHSEYYKGAGTRFPVESETPNLVYFLAVSPEVRFLFGVAPRRAGLDSLLLTQAMFWLKAGLTYLGAGAKTGAGYGRFAFDVALDRSTVSKTETYEVELITPAFLAGANQQAADATLRGATIKGLLRHWWRTMHSGFLTAAEMHRLESLVFGNTKSGGAVTLSVTGAGKPSVQAFDRQGIVFSNSLPKPSGHKTSQGLVYASYGTDEAGKRRQVIAPGAQWKIQLTARSTWQDTSKRTGLLPAEVLFEQAEAALALLIRFGAVGSKSKKGFGSLQSVTTSLPGLDEAKKAGQKFRDALSIRTTFNQKVAQSPSLENMLPPLRYSTNWTNPWLALDQYGTALQAYAQAKKHQNEKKALGTPRKVVSPPGGPRFPERHASPVQVHFTKAADGKLDINIWMFPSNELPDSQRILKELHTHLDGAAVALGKSLPSLIKAQVDTGFVERPGQGSTPARAPPGRSGFSPGRGAPSVPSLAPAAAKPSGPKNGDLLDVELLEERTKKGSWKARDVGSGRTGPVLNTTEVPATAKPGDKVNLIAHSVPLAGEITFRWPVAAPPKK